MPVKPPGPHDTAMVFSAGNATSAARAIRAIIGASAVAWPCEVAMISCAGGRPAPAPGSSSATEQADPDVSIASMRRGDGGRGCVHRMADLCQEAHAGFAAARRFARDAGVQAACLVPACRPDKHAPLPRSSGPMSLIDISPPAFDLDIALAYATPDNITGKPFYRADARPYLHPKAVECLHGRHRAGAAVWAQAEDLRRLSPGRRAMGAVEGQPGSGIRRRSQQGRAAQSRRRARSHADRRRTGASWTWGPRSTP